MNRNSFIKTACTAAMVPFLPDVNSGMVIDNVCPKCGGNTYPLYGMKTIVKGDTKFYYYADKCDGAQCLSCHTVFQESAMNDESKRLPWLHG